MVMTQLLRLILSGKDQIEPVRSDPPRVEHARERLKTAQNDFILAVSGVVAQNEKLRRARHVKKNS